MLRHANLYVMAYFLRTLFIYLLFIGATSFGIHRVYYHYYADELPTDTQLFPTSLTFGLPSLALQPRETETGLLLSGMTAQNRRDWQEAWKNFSKLNDRYDSNPDFALRAFALALGNGQFDKAEDIAHKLNESFVKKSDPQDLGTKYDLIYLFLAFEMIKDENYQEAMSLTENLTNGPLAKFSQSLLESWINAEINPAAITSSVEDLSPLQMFYKALAAEYVEDYATAKAIMNKVDYNIMTPEKIATIAGFYVRMDQQEKAIDLVRRNLVKYAGNEDLGILLANLQAQSTSAHLRGHNDFHFKGPAVAIAKAYHDFALVMLSEGAIDSTLLFSRMAAYLAPELDDIYITIADVLKYQGQDEQALEEYKKIKADDEDYERAVAERISILLDRKDFADAEAIIRNSLKIQNDEGMSESPYFYFLLGNAQREQKNYTDAIISYTRSEELGLQQNDGELPTTLWPIYYARAIVYDITDQWEKSEKDLLKALEKFPNSPIILNYLGYAYADREMNLDNAEEMISQAVLGAPNDPYIIDSMGWILYRKGDFHSAVNFLERAASLKPYHMVINDHLGDAYWKVGRKVEAYYMWQRALDYYDSSDEEQMRMIEKTKQKVEAGL